MGSRALYSSIEITSVERSGPGVLSFQCSPFWGGAGTSLVAQVRGKKISVFPQKSASDIEARIQKNTNVAFEEWMAPLFPLANRLRLNQGEALVSGVPVRMPENLSQGVHLHGLLYDRRADHTEVSSDGSSVRFDFKNALREYWHGSAAVSVTHAIRNGVYVFSMVAKNTGKLAIPVGFGAHPYFQIPSGDPTAVLLKVGSSYFAEVDDLKSVLPTGRWSSVGGTPVDFRKEVPLPSQVVDHYFRLDPEARPQVELIDLREKILYRVTGLTPNITGAQIYYPGHGSVVAIEWVTHHPDPRAEVWGDQSTGIQLLQPGKETNYSFQIEVMELGSSLS